MVDLGIISIRYTENSSLYGVKQREKGYAGWKKAVECSIG